ncbi:PI-PLC X-box domain-containing protein [Operophtera brumata]|uniref:PI-PLC X-box domain-containing protein n=1 Tax=Operophtera brumata TaxID=104452 RepID=A0A0L7LUC7_OPEBR|nr:PI-PLC X-box domain-containing protein [Operophtera brumata]
MSLHYSPPNITHYHRSLPFFSFITASAATAEGPQRENESNHTDSDSSQTQSIEKSSCGRVWVTIGLFDDRPGSWSNALAVYPIRSAEGHVVTNVSLGEGSLPAGWEQGVGHRGPHCLWPWAGAGDGQIQAYNCLKIQPTWMEDNAGKINGLRIGDLVLAGTHNAGAWRFDTEVSAISRDSFVLVHAGLLELVQRELGPHLAVAQEFGTGAGTRGPTLKSLLDADKRLLKQLALANPSSPVGKYERS